MLVRAGAESASKADHARVPFFALANLKRIAFRQTCSAWHPPSSSHEEQKTAEQSPHGKRAAPSFFPQAVQCIGELTFVSYTPRRTRGFPASALHVRCGRSGKRFGVVGQGTSQCLHTASGRFGERPNSSCCRSRRSRPAPHTEERTHKGPAHCSSSFAFSLFLLSSSSTTRTSWSSVSRLADVPRGPVGRGTNLGTFGRPIRTDFSSLVSLAPSATRRDPRPPYSPCPMQRLPRVDVPASS
jgi:hypothetical protein